MANKHDKLKRERFALSDFIDAAGTTLEPGGFVEFAAPAGRFVPLGLRRAIWKWWGECLSAGGPDREIYNPASPAAPADAMPEPAGPTEEQIRDEALSSPDPFDQW